MPPKKTKFEKEAAKKNAAERAKKVGTKEFTALKLEDRNYLLACAYSTVSKAKESGVLTHKEQFVTDPSTQAPRVASDVHVWEFNSRDAACRLLRREAAKKVSWYFLTHVSSSEFKYELIVNIPTGGSPGATNVDAAVDLEPGPASMGVRAPRARSRSPSRPSSPSTTREPLPESLTERKVPAKWDVDE